MKFLHNVIGMFVTMSINLLYFQEQTCSSGGSEAGSHADFPYRLSVDVSLRRLQTEKYMGTVSPANVVVPFY